MGVIPKVERLGPGQYRVHSGEEHVSVFTAYRLKKWFARPKGSSVRNVFQTKRDAVDWAHDWLAEHA